VSVVSSGFLLDSRTAPLTIAASVGVKYGPLM
jgi:hypothetical protein